MINAHSKRWWNGEIQQKKCQLWSEQRGRRRSAAKAQAKADLQKSVRRANDQMWNDYLKHLRVAEVWGAPKVGSRQAGLTV